MCRLNSELKIFFLRLNRSNPAFFYSGRKRGSDKNMVVYKMNARTWLFSL